MKKTAKRLLAAVLCLIMLLGVIPLNGFDIKASALTYSPKSSSYANSVYYSNLQNVTLTGNQRDDIVKIALSQVGYHEGKNTSDQGGNSSSKLNYTEYGQWFGKNGVAWCAIFISWCANLAGVPTSVIKKNADSSKKAFCTKGYYTVGKYTPQKGDIAYINNNQHVALIYNVDANYIYTIDGNFGDKVKNTSKYKRSDWKMPGESYYIAAIGAPAYEGTSIVASPDISTSNYVGGVNVSLACSTSGATIYYTTDGSNPTTSSTQYTGQFSLTSTATVKAFAVKNGSANSSVASSQVTVGKTSTPQVSYNVSESGFNVSISCESGSAVYYTTDGSTPTLSSYRYTGQFTTSDATVIKAIASKSGKCNSDISSVECTASVPAVPVVSLESSSTVGIGDEIAVKWDPVPNAAYYEVRSTETAVISDEETNIVNNVDFVYGNIFTMKTSEAAEYTITVTAGNFKGESTASNKVTVKSKANVTA